MANDELSRDNNKIFELDGGRVKSTRRGGCAKRGWLAVVVRIRMGEGYKREGERLCGVSECGH